MVVAIPIGVFAAIFLAYCLRLLLMFVLGYLLYGMADKVPVVGGQIKKAITAVLNYVETQWDKHVQVHLDAGMAWLTAIANTIRDLPETVAELSTRTAHGFERMVEVVIPRAITARLAPVWKGIDDLGGRLDNHLARLGGIDNALDAIRDVRIPNLREALQSGIDDLRNLSIPALRGELWRGIDDLRGQLAAQLGGAVAGLTKGIDYIRGVELPALDRRLLTQAAEIAGLAAIVATVVMPAVETVTKCRRKLGWLCTTDEGLWDDVFGDLIPFIGLGAAVAMVDEMQGLAESAAEGIRAIMDG